MDDSAQSQDRFCEEQMRTRRPVSLSELSFRTESLRVGERSQKESADIFADLRQLPCRNAYALDPGAPIRDPRTGQVVTRPDAPTVLKDFILELPGEPDDRRAVFQGIRRWVEPQGHEVPADTGQRFIFLRIK